MGERVPSPEISNVWDDLGRWEETARWTWNTGEHNNILEGRAALVAVKIATREPKDWRKRHLVMSDSQVVIGVFGKGRSSKHEMNCLARRLCAMVVATGVKVYFRYVRTHRNHADGPSRGYPLGVAPKQEAGGSLELSDFFYTHTRG